MFVIKSAEKMPDPSNAKEYYQSIIIKKNTRTSHKLSKTEKISSGGSGKKSDNSSCNETKKGKNFLHTKQSTKKALINKISRRLLGLGSKNTRVWRNSSFI